MRFPDLFPVFLIVGLLVVGEAILAALFALVDWTIGAGNADAFALAALLSFFVGGLAAVANWRPLENLNVRQGFVLTTCAWTIIPAFAALPLFFSDLDISYTDAYFESLSGMSTTGSTVLSGLDSMDPVLLMWRAVLQWIGGIGIIVTAIAVLPILRVGGMQLFQAESSEQSEKMLPRASQVARTVSLVYLGLTVACAVAYAVAGMGVFDAVAHAMTTIPTAGYSTSDGSMGAFGAGPQWVGTVFMISGAIPFVLYIRASRGHFRDFLESGQLRLLLAILGGVTLVLTAWLAVRADMPFFEALRHTAFNVTSVVTTTGFVSDDYATWGGFAVSMFFLLTFVGGCTGSTAGGLKMFRFIVLYRIFRAQMINLFSPNAVVPMLYDGKPIPDDVPQSVIAFAFLYFMAAAVIALVLSELGLDPVTAVSSAATAIANVGPGLGDIVGPAGNFSSLPDTAKWVLCVGMLLGRLELFTVLVLLTPRFWRA